MYHNLSCKFSEKICLHIAVLLLCGPRKFEMRTALHTPFWHHSWRRFVVPQMFSVWAWLKTFNSWVCCLAFKFWCKHMITHISVAIMCQLQFVLLSRPKHLQGSISEHQNCDSSWKITQAMKRPGSHFSFLVQSSQILLNVKCVYWPVEECLPALIYKLTNWTFAHE